MKNSFLSLWEAIHPLEKDVPPDESGIESKSMHAIKTGLNIDGGDFWNNFLEVLNNRDGMAELLEVRPDQISRWSSRIRELLSQTKNLNRKNTMISTGENVK